MVHGGYCRRCETAQNTRLDWRGSAASGLERGQIMTWLETRLRVVSTSADQLYSCRAYGANTLSMTRQVRCSQAGLICSAVLRVDRLSFSMLAGSSPCSAPPVSTATFFAAWPNYPSQIEHSWTSCKLVLTCEPSNFDLCDADYAAVILLLTTTTQHADHNSSRHYGRRAQELFLDSMPVW